MQRLRQILSHPAIWMVVVLLAAYWQVSLCRYTLIWDSTDQIFPWHRYISECFHAGIIPLWSPYIKLGYPIYADPQGGIYNPLIWLLGTISRYTLSSNNWELILQVIFAAFGMKYLLETVGVKRFTAALFGLVYAMSGPFLSNASHLTLIGSLCWIPFLAASYIRFLRAYRVSDLLLVAIFAFLELTAGYAGITIIMVYIIIAMLIFYMMQRWKAREGQFGKVAFMHLVLGVVAIGLSAGFLYVVAQGQPYIDRGEGVSRATAGAVPFTPASLITMVYPRAMGTDMVDFDTNITMQDLYIGIIPLLLMFTCVFLRRKASTYVILTGSIFMLLASMGDHTPVRGWLYDFVPGMRLFRHAGIFRLLTCMGFVVLAALGFDIVSQSLADRPTTPRTIRSISALAVILIIADMVISVQGAMTKTIISGETVATVQAHLDRYPQGFPIPYNGFITSVSQWNDSTISPPIWHNAGYIRKQISYEGDNRFQLKTYAALYTQPDFYQRYEHRRIIETDSEATVQMTAFSPGIFDLNVSSGHTQTVTLAQMYYPGWRVRVDNIEAQLIESRDHFISCQVAPGAHHVQMYYENVKAKAAFIYTVIAFMVTLAAIAILKWREKLN